jgi:hypothetical protein
MANGNATGPRLSGQPEVGDVYGKIAVEVVEYPVPDGAEKLQGTVQEVIWMTETRQRLLVGAPQLYFTHRAPRSDEVADRRSRGMTGAAVYNPVPILLIIVTSLPGPPLPDPVDTVGANGHT